MQNDAEAEFADLRGEFHPARRWSRDADTDPEFPRRRAAELVRQPPTSRWTVSRRRVWSNRWDSRGRGYRDPLHHHRYERDGLRSHYHRHHGGRCGPVFHPVPLGFPVVHFGRGVPYGPAYGDGRCGRYMVGQPSSSRRTDNSRRRLDNRDSTRSRRFQSHCYRLELGWLRRNSNPNHHPTRGAYCPLLPWAPVLLDDRRVSAGHTVLRGRRGHWLVDRTPPPRRGGVASDRWLAARHSDIGSPTEGVRGYCPQHRWLTLFDHSYRCQRHLGRGSWVRALPVRPQDR